METDSSQTSWLYAPNYQVNSQKRKESVGKVFFFFFKGEGGVESVKHLYLVEHKSSRELYHNDKHQSHTKIRQWNTWSYRAEQGAILNILLLSYFSLFWPGLSVLLNGYQGGMPRNPTTHHMGQLNGFITDYCSEKSLRCTSKFMMAQENEGGKFYSTHKKSIEN